jgi:hypothetical protein
VGQVTGGPTFPEKKTAGTPNSAHHFKPNQAIVSWFFLH